MSETGNSRKRQRAESPSFTRQVSSASLSLIINHDPPEEPHQQQPQIISSPTFHAQVEPRPQSPMRLEPNLFGPRPAEDIVRVVADFIYTHMKDRTNLEIEGKLGRLVDRKTKQRIALPVLSETVLADDKDLRFESDMTLQQHAMFNKILNQRVDETRRPEHRGSRVEYRHTKEIDHFYRVDGTRVRVTTNKESGEIISVITKNRIADLNIYSPRTKLDIRISINEELTMAKPDMETNKAILERHKDRLSYKQDLWSIDLTQVISPEQEKGPANPYALGPPKTTPATTTHELEVEVANPQAWLAERAKVAAGKPNNFHEITHTFLGNLRALAKRAI
ncbi:mRNA-capping enzyme subunit beta [Coemansia sp. Benny D115]|nr:mRNA-capping enzyme subunit beta [Coemansia sp. Benny D115]